MIFSISHRTRERVQDVNYWFRSFLRNIGTTLEEDSLDTEVINYPYLALL